MAHRHLLFCIGLLLVGWVRPTYAQPDRGQACATVLQSIWGQQESPDFACTALAIAVQDSLASLNYAYGDSVQAIRGRLARSAVTARALQLPQGQVGYDVGSPAQGGAVPSIQPVAIAGGNVSAVGTEAGARAIATLSLNPASFFVDAEENDSLATALGDIGDLTVLLPVEGQGGEEESEAIDYLGLRSRINITGLTRRGQRYQRVVEQFRDVLQQSGRQVADIERLLGQTSDVRGCTRALLQSPDQGLDDVQQACGGTITRIDAQEYDRLRELVEEALREADESFLGLDLRTDFGDPTLGVADSARGTRLYAGVAAGRRFAGPAGGRNGVKGRLGVAYVDLVDRSQTNFAFEGGIDYEIQKRYQDQRLQVAVGLEFSYSDVSGAVNEALQTDYLQIRGAINVPLTRAYSLAVNVGAPVIGNAGTTLSVKVNWNLLWPGASLPAGR